jgi:hypothetical protein
VTDRVALGDRDDEIGECPQVEFLPTLADDDDAAFPRAHLIASITAAKAVSETVGALNAAAKRPHLPTNCR